MNCTQCGAPLLGEGRFCNQCGAPAPPPGAQRTAGVPPSAPQAPAPLPPGACRVCPQCGVIAPTARSSCVVCGASLASPHVVPARADGSYWACVLEGDFACRGCGLRSPFDGLDIDGEVECRRCGLVQPFMAGLWNSALLLAIDVADCSGPPGRRPPVANSRYSEIGQSVTTAESTLELPVLDGSGLKTASLHIKVSPGVPLCERCKVPLDVVVGGAGPTSTQTSCPQCHEQARYQVRGNLADVAGDVAAKVVGVIADDLRADRPPVRVVTSPGGGAVALTCPTCSAPLPITDPSASLVICPYCRTAARIPGRLHWRVTGQPPAHRPWWVLFHGDSELRSSPEDDDDDDDDDDDYDDDDDTADSVATARAAQAAQAAEEVRARKSRRNNAVSMAAILSVFVGFLTFAFTRKHQLAEERQVAASAATAADDAPTPPARAPEPLDRSAFHDLDGCSCKSGNVAAALAVRIASGNTSLTVGVDDGFVTSFDLSWLLDTGSRGFAVLVTGADLAPPPSVKGRTLGLGVACAGDVFATVAMDRVTGWSMTTKLRLWDRRLPAEFKISVPPAKKGLSIQCATVPSPGGVLSVPMTNGKTQRIKLAFGEAVK